MKVSELFPAKSTRSRKKLPGGLTPEQAHRIEAQFDKLIRPVGDKATQYFRSFTVNGKHRFWLLPNSELWVDLPIDKKAYVLKFPSWFVAEINKVELDEILI